jgi:hypothetical protein
VFALGSEGKALQVTCLKPEEFIASQQSFRGLASRLFQINRGGNASGGVN